MGFLNPFLLLLGAAAAVPLILHLLRREQHRRIPFPALRYLQRTTKEHAREIRFRQLLLLLLRISAVILLTFAAARLFLPIPGGEHEPTALVIVLDNSLSSGVVEDDVRRLDRMKGAAIAALERATSRDRVWVLRAGEPWDLASPLPPAGARSRIERTGVSHAGSILPETLQRASELLRTADLAARELHVLSDFQETAFTGGVDWAFPDGIRILAVAPPDSAWENRFLDELIVGGGLLPLAGERTNVAARVRSGTDGPVQGTLVRLVIDGEVRGVGEAAVDGSVSLPLGPLAPGWTSGRLEMDPDLLADDDRLFFAFRVRDPPSVRLEGAGLAFLSEALQVLEESNRIRRPDEGPVELEVRSVGPPVPSPEDAAATLFVPPPDPTQLTAFNRVLEAAGVPWYLEPDPAEASWTVEEVRIPPPLGGIRVDSRYRMVSTLETAHSPPLVELSDGTPWLVHGEGETGPYLLMASPMVDEATELPVRAAVFPFLEWILGEWIGEGPSRGVAAGEELPVPSAATHVRAPDGTRYELEGTGRFTETRTVGVHAVLAGDSLLQLAAVNAPARESVLVPVPAPEVQDRLSATELLPLNEGSWRRASFRSGTGREPWRILLVTALLFLLVETWIASAGSTDRRGAERGTAFDRPAGTSEV